MNEQKMLMTQGTIWKILIRFSFPLALGGLFQELYNAVDSWVVGHYCGDTALAAVSSSWSLCFLLIGFFQGVFLGGSVVISNRYGARQKEGVDTAIHTMVLFSLLIGVVLTLLGIVFTPTILQWMDTPAKIMPSSVLYFRIYSGGLMALVLYNSATGIFQALGDSRHPLYYLIIASVANVGLDFLFVAGFDWGVGGAALATVLGQLISAVLAFAHLMSGRFVVRIRLKKLRIEWRTFKQVVRLGIPSGVQNSVIGLANVVVQSNINPFGDSAVAGCGSYAKVEGFVFLPITSLAMAITTFISQNLGAGNPIRARSGARQGIVLTVVLAELVGVAYFLLAPQLIGIFSDTPAVLSYGVQQAHVETLAFFLLGFSHASAAVMRGVNRPLTPMIVMLSCWCIFRIIYITFMMGHFHNILVVFSAYPITWFLSTVLFLIALRWVKWNEDAQL